MSAPKPSDVTRLRAWALAWALVGTVIALWTALVPLEGVPHLQDEVIYTLQARALAGGGLGWPSPEPLALGGYHFVLDVAGTRYGVFPTGWPAVLAVGEGLGLAAWVNPVLHGLTVLLGGWLVLGVRERAAWLVTPLLALSPALLLQAGSTLSHTLAALLALGALAVVRGAGDRSAWAAGACLGLLVLTRPLDAVVLLAVLVPWLRTPRRLALGAVVPALAVGVTAAVNAAITGDPLYFPVTQYFDHGPPPTSWDVWRYGPGCNSLGLGESIGCFPTYGDHGHTLDKALKNGGRLLQLSGRLWLGLPLLLLPALWAPRRLLLSGVGLLALATFGYALYWVPGVGYGARFTHVAAPVCICLVALGADSLRARWPQVPALALGLLLIPAAWRFTAALPELDHYWGVDGRFAQLEQAWTGPDALILVAYVGEPTKTALPQTTGGDMRHHHGFWRGSWLSRPIGALAFGELQPGALDAAVAAHPDREPWVYLMHPTRDADQLLPLGSVGFPDAPATGLPVDPFVMGELPAPVIDWSGPLPR